MQAINEIIFRSGTLRSVHDVCQEVARWTYADAARICRGLSEVEYGADGETFVEEFPLAKKCVEAIEARAK